MIPLPKLPDKRDAIELIARLIIHKRRMKRVLRDIALTRLTINGEEREIGFERSHKRASVKGDLRNPPYQQLPCR